MEEPIQFSVTRIGPNAYRIIEQNEKEITNTFEGDFDDVIEEINYIMQEMRAISQ